MLGDHDNRVFSKPVYFQPLKQFTNFVVNKGYL